MSWMSHRFFGSQKNINLWEKETNFCDNEQDQYYSVIKLTFSVKISIRFAMFTKYSSCH